MRSRLFQLTTMLCCVLPAAARIPAQGTAPATPSRYPAMALLERYLIADAATEAALARTAAPPSISDHADVMVLGRTGYTTIAHGSNGFVCLVERGWSGPMDDPDFWNPAVRAPICFNRPAARAVVPVYLLKTRLVLQGKPPKAITAALVSAFDRKQLPTPEPGAMCYMLSRQQYIGDEAKAWRPHLMFFTVRNAADGWGENVAGSPVIGADSPEERVMTYMVPVAKWSDGTLGAPVTH